MHGGVRKGAGRPPAAGERRYEVLQVPLTAGEKAELLDAAGDVPLATWVRELALRAARGI